MINREESVLLCPRNDEESVLILKIAKAAGIPTVVSSQSHGSRLGREERLAERLKEANPQASTVVIVEIPGPEEESELQAAGWRVVVIDHHRYEGLDRMKQESSLDQFLAIFSIADEELQHLGFDPFLVKGVGMMDRGWVWELKHEGLNREEAKRVLEFYLEQLEDLGGLRKEAMEEAKRAWEEREERDGVIIIRSASNDFRIREPISILLADLFDEPPTTIILEGNHRISVQDTDKAVELHGKLGGYVFGKDRCWGYPPTEDDAGPTVEQILAVIRGE